MPNRFRGKVVLLLAVVFFIGAVVAPAQRKKKKEDETQTLQLPKELPSAVTGETRRLTFHVTPLSSKGLLSQQIRDALKAVAHEAGGETVLKIRAFVAGSGDLRRVRDLVSESFADRRQPLPALSLIQTGGLPLEGAQVQMEVIAAARKDVNPSGLAFISAQTASSDNPQDPVPPLTEKALRELARGVEASGSTAADVLRVTCFFSSLENLAASRQQVEAMYPRAAHVYVQTQRAPALALASCEAVAKLHTEAGARFRVIGKDKGESQAVLIGAPHVVITGTQVSFGYEEKDARLAFERLNKALQQAGVSARDVAFAHYYPLSTGIANQVRKVRTEFFDPAEPPAGSMLLFESLPSMDAGFAVDVIAVKQ